MIPYVSGVCTYFEIYVKEPKPPPGTIGVRSKKLAKTVFSWSLIQQAQGLCTAGVSAGEVVQGNNVPVIIKDREETHRRQPKQINRNNSSPKNKLKFLSKHSPPPPKKRKNKTENPHRSRVVLVALAD